MRVLSAALLFDDHLAARSPVDIAHRDRGGRLVVDRVELMHAVETRSEPRLDGDRVEAGLDLGAGPVVIEQAQDLDVAVMIERVEDALLLHQAMRERVVALLVLHAVLALQVRPRELELNLASVAAERAVEHLLEDLVDAHVLEDPGVSAHAQEAQRGDELDADRFAALEIDGPARPLVAGAESDARDNPAEAPLIARALEREHPVFAEHRLEIEADIETAEVDFRAVGVVDRLDDVRAIDRDDRSVEGRALPSIRDGFQPRMPPFRVPGVAQNGGFARARLGQKRSAGAIQGASPGGCSLNTRTSASPLWISRCTSPSAFTVAVHS